MNTSEGKPTWQTNNVHLSGTVGVAIVMAAATFVICAAISAAHFGYALGWDAGWEAKAESIQQSK